MPAQPESVNGWIGRLQLSLQKNRDLPESRFFQMATADKTGKPENRTVVFRSFDEKRNTIRVISDLRTPKVAEIAANCNVAICWYFSRTREQFRFSATACVITGEQNQHLITESWQALSEQGKKQFLWGQPKTPLDENAHLVAVEPANRVPTHFCVIELAVKTADYLNLRGNPQYRELYSLDNGQWIAEPVIP